MIHVKFTLGDYTSSLGNDHLQQRLGLEGLNYTPTEVYTFNLNPSDVISFNNTLFPRINGRDYCLVELDCGECNIHDLAIGLSLFCDIVQRLESALILDPYTLEKPRYFNQSGLYLFLNITTKENRSHAVSFLKAGLVATSRNWHKTFTMNEDKLIFKEFCLNENTLIQTDQSECFLLSDNCGLDKLYSPLDIVIAAYIFSNTNKIPLNLRVRGLDSWKGADYAIQLSTPESAIEFKNWLFQVEPVTLSHDILIELGFELQ